MSILSVSPDDDVLRRFGKQLAELGKPDADKVVARAVNRVTDMAYTRTTRATAKQSSIPLKIVRGSTFKSNVKPGSDGELEGKIYAKGDPIPLKAFKPKQFSYGVKVKIWGQSSREEGLFIFAGTHRSGIEAGNGHVFKNTRRFSSKSQRSNAIERQVGPAVPTEIVRDQSREAFDQTVSQMLPARLKHELGRLMHID